MPTYSLSARNQFRSPSGAVGEAPDGPGGIAALRDDVDNYLGLGGAEYCANAAALTAIPSSRLFAGKRAYRADLDTVFRYVGTGNTSLRGNDTTHAWQAWEKPATPFTPAWTNLTIGSSTVFALYGIEAGMAWFDISVVAGTGYALTSTAADVGVTAPTPMNGSLGVGSGQYGKASAAGNNNQVDLAIYMLGTSGTASTTTRIRAKWANAAPGAVTDNFLGSVVTSTTTDSFQVGLRSPSTLVA